MCWKQFGRWGLAVSGVALVLSLACGEQSAPTAPSQPERPTAATTVATHHATPPEPEDPTPTPTPIVAKPVHPATGGSPPETDEPPDLDLFELAQRLRPSANGPASRTLKGLPPTRSVGDTETFFVTDNVDSTTYTVAATLAVVSENAYWYVDDSLDLSSERLNRAAAVYEVDIRPLMVSSFGDIWNPGVDNDPRLAVLHTPLRGVFGYYGGADEYPIETHPNSNQREMIYLDSSRLQPGSAAYLGVLTHELQHAIHWNADSSEEVWINEGMSELAQELAGYRTGSADAFLGRPATQLNFWPDALGAAGPHYGASVLFLDYLAQQFGGYSSLKKLISDKRDGALGLDAYLSSYDTSFVEVFGDWVVANYLDEPEGPYGYPDRSVRVQGLDRLIDYGGLDGEIPQFSALYADLRLPPGDAVVSFEGDTEAVHVDTECRSGRYCWWGNRGDSIDTTLTQEFDLSALTEATLTFWTWYRIEEDWDYAYIEASGDDGATWSLLEGRLTTSDNPTGNSFGHGLTGASDGWVQETVDLTLYAGGKVQVRFEYVTDGAVYLDGVVLDDISIPELGLVDDAEGPDNWVALGFERIDNVLPQQYLVQVIEVREDGTATVRSLDLDTQNRGQLTLSGFGSVLDHAVVVVSPVAQGTHRPARYSLSFEPSP